jgi:hypothetical protein
MSKADAEEYEKVPLLPGPGARLRDDGTWLEPQSNGGYLYRQRGGKKGPTPAELRKRMRGDLAEGMHVAAAVLADEDAKTREKLQALEFLAKYGIGQRKDTFSPELIKALALAVQAEVKDEQILARVERRWAEVLKQHLTGDME